MLKKSEEKMKLTKLVFVPLAILALSLNALAARISNINRFFSFYPSTQGL